MPNREKPELREQVKALAEKEWTYQRIADELGISVQRVAYYASNRLDKERKKRSVMLTVDK